MTGLVKHKTFDKCDVISIARILSSFDRYPDSFKCYFNHFPSLARDYPWDVSISYLFAKTELAQNITIYSAVVKCHRVEASMAKSSIDTLHMTRARFCELYNVTMGTKISTDAIAESEIAEKVRDRILHGKTVSESDRRKAVVSVLEYANLLNEQVAIDAGFRPFGSMQGFKGRGQSLDRPTSRWVLIGMGLIHVKDKK